MDPTNNNREEDTLDQASGMFVDEQPAQGEDVAICGTRNQRDYSHQSNPGHDGNNQALGNLALWENGFEGGAIGSMEIERH